MAYRRRFKRTFRRRRFRRRFSRRFSIRKTLRRRPLRPEVKWIDRANAQNSFGVAVDGGLVYSHIVTPPSITQGTNRDQRVGNNVKFRYVKLNVALTCYPELGSTNTITRVRMLLVSPTVDAASYDAYTTGGQMNTDLRVGFIDTNICHVYYDKEFEFGNFISITQYLSTGQRNSMNIARTIAFPRNVNFRAGTNDVTDAKDTLRLLVFNVTTDVTRTQPVSVYCRARTTFTDA